MMMCIRVPVVVAMLAAAALVSAQESQGKKRWTAKEILDESGPLLEVTRQGGGDECERARAEMGSSPSADALSRYGDCMLRDVEDRWLRKDDAPPTAKASPSARGGVLIHNGFHTGSQYRKLHESHRQAHTSGFINGLLDAPLLGAPEASVEWLARCVRGRADGQLSAAIDQWLERRPMEWHMAMNHLAYRAISDVCAGK